MEGYSVDQDKRDFVLKININNMNKGELKFE